MILFLLLGCSPPARATEASLPLTLTPTGLPTATLPEALWINPAVPPALRKTAEGWGVPITDDPHLATLRLDIEQSALPASTWIYALVAPFPTVTDEVTSDELHAAWNGSPSGPFAGEPLLMDESTLAAFSSLWGEAAPGSVQIVSPDLLLDQAWTDMPSWAIIPFESIQPRWKVLMVDGHSPIHKEFDGNLYPLQVRFALVQSQPGSQLQTSFDLPASNRDPRKLTTVILTGVTALVRATAATMEMKGVTYPGSLVRDWLREADVTHISNEVPFDAHCPPPNPGQTNFILCSDPKYIELLTDVGTDVVELTGDHFADRGVEAMLDTLALYDEVGLPYYGGGANADEARKPLRMEVNGNQLAFMGCNGKRAGKYPKATDTVPGAAGCDYDYIAGQIRDLKAQGYMVIFTFQHEECYSSGPCYTHLEAFRRVAQAGAVVVSGSQAHYPHIMEFYSGAFVHYGLGNLFFDQMTYNLPNGETIDETRLEFLDRHVFYDGRYLGVELLTAMLEDYARPRPMTERERTAFLSDYFYFSGWIPFSPTPVPAATVTLTPIALPGLLHTPTP
jgi:hypothetical protein